MNPKIDIIYRIYLLILVLLELYYMILKTQFNLILTLILLVSICIYYFLNRPSHQK